MSKKSGPLDVSIDQQYVLRFFNLFPNKTGHIIYTQFEIRFSIRNETLLIGIILFMVIINPFFISLSVFALLTLLGCTLNFYQPSS